MNDDDADFKPSQSTSSNLTSLFDSNRPRPGDNQTLTYTAPKPPKSGESSRANSRVSSSKNLGTEKLEIIISKNIQLYKLENGKYGGQGAAGIAIIGQYDLHLYQIILYKNNKEYLSKTYVQPNFTFTVLENNYASFYDNSRQNWSILFPSSSDTQQFAKQVAIAKYNSQNKQEKIIVQDLTPSGAIKANKNDIVKIEYSCSLLNHDDIAPLKEKSYWLVEIADNYTFPWQEGLKDCGIKTKRVVIIPYKLSAPWTDEIQQNSPVLVEFEVESVNSPELPGQIKTTKPVKAKTQDESATDSSAEEDNCKAKPVSLKDSIFLSRSHKADLISRIAKMGQALPLKVAFACGSSELPDDPSKQANHQMMPSNVRPCSPQQTDTNQPYLLSTSSSRRCENDVVWQQQHTRGGVNFAYQELYPMMSGPPGPSGAPGMGVETTGTDAELRITINKVSEKVDHVLNKLQNFDAAGWDKVKAHQSATMLDPMSVINSIQDVMAENECLKKEIQQQKSKINEQGSKLHSLMELTQRCVERCTFSERKPVVNSAPDRTVGLDDSQTTSDQLRGNDANMRLNQLTSEIERFRKEISENQQQIRQCNAEIQSLVDKLREKENVIRKMETELDETAAENKALTSANELHRWEIQRFKQQAPDEKPTELQPVSSEDLVEEIKKVMNAVNRKLQSYFDSDQSYSGKDVKATIATTLKDVTMEYLKYRTKQKNASRMDVGQRDMSGSAETRRGIPYGRASAEPIVEPDNLRKDKSKIAHDVTRATSQRLAFADEQASESTEEPERSISRGTQKSNIRLMAPSTAEVNAISQDSRAMDSTLHIAAKGSSIHQSLRSVEPTSSQRSSDVSHRPMSDTSALTQEAKSTGTFRSESQRESDAPSHTIRIPSSKGSSMQSSSRRSTLTSSRLPSAGDESVRGDISTMTGELESLMEDQEAENVEIEKSTVTLTNTLSDVTRGPSAPPPSFRSTMTDRADTSSTLVMDLSKVVEEPTQSTLTAGGQLSETEESFVLVNGERSGEIQFESGRNTIESETDNAFGRSTLSNREVDAYRSEKGSEMNAGTRSRTVTEGKSTVDVSGISSRRSSVKVRGESGEQGTSNRSTVSAKGLPSEMDVSFAKFDDTSRRETTGDESSKTVENFREVSASTIGSSKQPPQDSNMSTTNANMRDVRMSISETDLGKINDSLQTQLQDGSFANVETEKSSVVLNKTPSNVTRGTSIQAPSERSASVDVGSDHEDFGERKSEQEDEGNGNVRDTISSEELGKESERDEAEKNSIDEKVSSSNSDENIKSSGSNALHESSRYSDYYQGWESSQPPPLPLEDEEDTSGTDEEWL